MKGILQYVTFWLLSFGFKVSRFEGRLATGVKKTSLFNNSKSVPSVLWTRPALLVTQLGNGKAGNKIHSYPLIFSKHKEVVCSHRKNISKFKEAKNKNIL